MLRDPYFSHIDSRVNAQSFPTQARVARVTNLKGHILFQHSDIIGVLSVNIFLGLQSEEPKDQVIEAERTEQTSLV